MRRSLLTVAVILAGLAAAHFEWFSWLEEETLGLRQVLRWSFAPSDPGRAPNPVIVSLDDAFYRNYGGYPLRRLDYARLARALDELGARVIAIDAVFDFANAYAMLLPDQDDPAVAGELAAVPRLLLASWVDDATPAPTVHEPIPAYHDIATTGYINPVTDSIAAPRVSRVRVRTDLAAAGVWPFAIQAVATARDVEPVLARGALGLGDRRIPLTRTGDVLIDFPDPTSEERAIISAGSLLPFSDSHWSELRELLAPALSGRIVLIGERSAFSQDLHETTVGPRYGVEILAAAISTLLNGAPLSKIPDLADGFQIAVALLLTGSLCGRASRLRAIPVLGGILVIWMTGSAYVYVTHGLVTSIAPVLVLAPLMLVVRRFA